MISTVSNSHSLRLLTRLHDIGIVERGGFVLARLQHDSWCPVLHTLSALDCRCDVEAVIDGDIYSFDEHTGEVWVRRGVRQ